MTEEAEEKKSNRDKSSKRETEESKRSLRGKADKKEDTPEKKSNDPEQGPNTDVISLKS